MNQNLGTPSLQAQRISVLPDPQVSVNVKNILRARAIHRNQDDPYPEVIYITPTINELVDDYVKDAIEDIIEALSVLEAPPIKPKTVMALIVHSIERIHYNNQQQGIQ